MGRKEAQPTSKIVQIKGSNGSGKTTLIKQLGELSDEWTYLEWPDGMVYATVFDNIRWVAIGKYDPEARMGGCDGLPSVDLIKRAILETLKQYPGFWIVFEGMMISTIKSTFYNFLLDIHNKHAEIEPLFVILKSTTEGCLKRIQGRGSMKPNINVDNVAGKCELVIKHAKDYDPALVRWINVDPDPTYVNVPGTPIEDMLGCFLWEVQDCELIDALYGNDFGGYDEE